MRAIRGYGLIKSGRATEGAAEISEALSWYEKSNLRYTRSLFSIWLAEGYLRSDSVGEARSVSEGVFSTSKELGYRHLEGVAQRLLGECWKGSDVGAAGRHLKEAVEILKAVDAKSELAKTWLVATSFANNLVEPSRVAAVRLEAAGALRELGTVHGE